eukprot:414057-Pelagomonas_calceolata.AAC.4
MSASVGERVHLKHSLSLELMSMCRMTCMSPPLGSPGLPVYLSPPLVETSRLFLAVHDNVQASTQVFRVGCAQSLAARCEKESAL